MSEQENLISQKKGPQEVKLFNTLSRSLEVFKPIHPGKVGLYCCGPTVYNYQHIGNLRTYIFEDVLARTLRAAGYGVTHVMNITDVGHLVSDADEGEDKMLLAAKREGKSSAEIAQFYTDIFLDHCDWLHIQRPNIICKATEHIDQMVALNKRLESKGFAYVSCGNLYFDVSRFPDYGKLAKLDLESLQAGARIEVDAKKRSPLDFALWFTQSKFLGPQGSGQELQWDSPWGRGYPGWHIECSAMSMNYLGEQFDIHCGGIDHIPVHHTNEIAQSQAATGKPLANVWMHGGFLVADKGKMSKSSGEFLTLDKVKQKGIDPIAYRLLCLGSSYRSELTWHWDALGGAAQTLKKLQNVVIEWQKVKNTLFAPGSASVSGPPASRQSELKQAFYGAMFHDLGTAKALALVHEIVGDGEISPGEKLQLLSEFDTILGLGVDSWGAKEIVVPSEVQQLIEERENARQQKLWQEADRLRSKVLDLGYLIVDTTKGPEVKIRP